MGIAIGSVVGAVGGATGATFSTYAAEFATAGTMADATKMLPYSASVGSVAGCVLGGAVGKGLEDLDYDIKHSQADD